MEGEGFIDSEICRKRNHSDGRQNDTSLSGAHEWRAETCADAVEVSGCEVVDPATLELKGAGAVDGRNGRVGLLHPVHQPLDLTVTAERVSSQVSERQAGAETSI